MATADVPTDDWLDLADEFSMVTNRGYRFQNVGSGSSPIEIVFASTKPALSEHGFVYENGEPVSLETLVYDGSVKIWAKAQRVPSRITLRTTA